MADLSFIVQDRRIRFASRFERTSDGYIYRPKPESIGFHVSASEREAFVRRYNASLYGSLIVGFLGMLVLIGLVIETLPDPAWPPLPAFAIGFGLIAIAAGFEVYDRWSSRAPARAIDARHG